MSGQPRCGVGLAQVAFVSGLVILGRAEAGSQTVFSAARAEVAACLQVGRGANEGQEAPERLPIGTEVWGVLEAGVGKDYELRVSRDGPVTIEVSSFDFDAVLRVQDGSGFLEDDDGGLETNARLVLDARRAATYRVLVAAKHERGGEYRLLAERGTVAPLTEAHRLDAAINFRDQAARRALERDDLLVAAAHRYRQGECCQRRSRFDEALRALEQARELFIRAGDRPREMQALNYVGQVHFSLGAYEEALPCFEEALAYYGEGGDTLEQGRLFLALGLVYRETGDLTKAEECYLSAEENTYGRDPLTLGRILRARGDLCAAQGNKSEAEELLAASKDIAEAQGDRRGLGKALESLGALAERHWELEPALAYYTELRELARSLGDRAAESAALGNLGVVYQQRGQYLRARECAERVLVIARETGARVEEATALGNLGVLWYAVKDYERALDYHRQHLELARELGDARGERRALNNIAMCEGAADTWEERAAKLGEALQAARDAGDLVRQARLRRQLASQLLPARPDVAQEHIREALRLRAETGTTDVWLSVEQGRLSFARDEYQEAFLHFEAALEQAQAQPDASAVMSSQRWLGQVKFRLGEHWAGLQFYERSVDRARRVGALLDAMRGLNGVGSGYWMLGRNEQALRAYDKGLELARQLHKGYWERVFLNDRGLVLHSLGDHEGAMATVREAASVTEPPPSDWARAIHAGNLAYYSLLAGRAEDAARHVSEALKISGSQEGSVPSDWRSLRGFCLATLAELHHMEGDATRARSVAEESLRLLEGWEANSLEGPLLACLLLVRIGIDGGELEEAGRYLEQAGGWIEDYILNNGGHSVDVGPASWLLPLREQLAQDLCHRRWLAAAEYPLARTHVAEEGFRRAGRSKGHALLGGILAHRRGLRSLEALEYQRELSQRNAEREVVLDRIGFALLEGTALEDVQDLRKDADELGAEVANLERLVRTIAPRGAAFSLPRGVDALTVGQQVIDEGTLLIEYADGTERLYAYVLDPEGAELLDLGERASIEAQAEDYVRRIGNPGDLASLEEVVERGTRLHETLLAPVLAARPGVKRILVVPTPALAALSFEALVIGGVEGSVPSSFSEVEFVLDRYEVCYAPSSPVLLELAEQRARRRGRLLLLADPLYADKPDPGEAAGRQEDLGLLLGERSLPDPGAFTRLPKTREEAFTIADLLVREDEEEARSRLASLRRARSGHVRSEEFDLYLGSEATTERLRQDLRDYAILHIAAHGHVDRQHPQDTGLALSFGAGGIEGGFFSVADALELDLDANLVVLSACDTASGKIRAGEGVESLARAFLYSGSRAVVASLWQVADWAAAETMQSFYRRATGGAPSLSQAMREAKLEVRRSETTRGVTTFEGGSAGRASSGHPFFWAPFIYIGLPR